MYSRNYFFSIIIVSQRMNQIEKRIFYAILGVAFILRFYNLWNLPFTNDELSTLNRLNYNAFNELLKHAIWTDGHPAGVQSFLWFYTRTFGTNPLVVKLPFVILGFLSLPLYFFAAKNLTNTRTALFTLAFLATLQFPLFYSQTIRPYSSGQFFAALSIFLWSKHLLISENKLNVWKSLPLAFSIFLSLSNHYFNGFLVFYLLPIGLLLNRKNLSIHYLTPWILGAILYIPQFNIFFHQLKVGSPGWLQTPNFNSLLEHIKYCFHFSYIYIVLFASLFTYSIIQNRSFPSIKRNAFLWAACFLIPILTAFIYSIYRAPIFQDSIFVFSFFFLFLFLGDVLLPTQINLKTLGIILTTIITTNLFTLIYNRQHYQQYFHHGYSQLTKDVLKFQTIQNAPIHVFGFEPFFYQYSANQINRKNSPMISFHRDVFFTDSAKTSQSFIGNFRNFADSQIIFANAIEIPLWCITILEKHYPFSIRKLHFGSEVYLFSKTNSILPSHERTFTANHLVINAENVPQKIKTLTIIPTNSSKTSYPLVSSEQYLETFEANMAQYEEPFGKSEFKHATLEIQAEIELPDTLHQNLGKIKLIASITNKHNETIHFMAQDFEKFHDFKNRKNTCYLVSSFNHFKFDQNCKFTFFIENELKQKIKILAPLKILLKSGNSNIYSLTNDF